jgi:hypothetical protein
MSTGDKNMNIGGVEMSGGTNVGTGVVEMSGGTNMAAGEAKTDTKRTKTSGAGCWKGTVTITRKADKEAFRVLSWLAKAASRDETRCFMAGIFNELADGKRIFAATDGRRLHMVEFPEAVLKLGKAAARIYKAPTILADIPAGRNLAFKAAAGQIVFTRELDGNFPNYKKVIPDITEVDPFVLNVSKELAYTEALYELYSRGIKVNAVHVAGLYDVGYSEWLTYNTENVVVFRQTVADVVYTAASAKVRM